MTAPTDPGPRPGTVLAAVLVTWAACTLGAAQFGYWSASLLTDRSSAVARIQDLMTADDAASSDFSAGTVATFYTVVMLVGLVWCLLAIGIAWHAFRGVRRARTALIVSALLATLLSVLALSVLSLLAGTLTLALLYTRSAKEWYGVTAPSDAEPRS